MRFALDDARTILRAGIDGTHLEVSFPAIARDGATMWLIYKDGEDGVAEGAVRLTTSTDEGETWAPSVAIFTPTLPTIAGPGGAVTLADGTWLATALTINGPPSSYTVVTLTSTDQGATWTTSAAITTHPFTSWVVVSGAPLQVTSGDVLIPIYGQDTSGNTYAAALASTDNGATWTTRASIKATGVDIQEPAFYETAPGTVVMLARCADHNIRRWTSTDSGTTWSAASVAWADDSRVNACRLRSGRWIVLSRDLNGAEQLRYSDDNLTTFSTPTLLLAPDSRATYADLVETTTDGKLLTVIGSETTGAVAGQPVGDIRARYVADGDTAAGRALAPKSCDTNARTRIAWDTFQRDNTLYAPGSADSGHQWRVIMTAGVRPGLVVNGNRLTCPAGVGAMGVIDCGTPDVDLEADLLWAAGSSGFGIRFRVDPTSGANLLAIFDSSATFLRIYTQPTATGTTTKIGEIALTNAVALNRWVTLRVRANGNVIKAYVDGNQRLEIVSTFNNSKTSHGVNLSGAGTSSHFCRRFTARGA